MGSMGRGRGLGRDEFTYTVDNPVVWGCHHRPHLSLVDPALTEVYRQDSRDHGPRFAAIVGNGDFR